MILRLKCSKLHAVPLVIIPILCLLVFVILPMAVLLLYPFKIFQRCLTCCRLDRPGLHALVDAYQGCFKNILTDGREGRYFAGLYLLFRFIYVAILVFSLHPFFISSWTHQDNSWRLALPLSGASLIFVFAGLVVLLRPYKTTSHNIIDFLTLFWMSVVGAMAITEVYVSPMLILYLFWFCYVISSIE